MVQKRAWGSDISMPILVACCWSGVVVLRLVSKLEYTGERADKLGCQG